MDGTGGTAAARAGRLRTCALVSAQCTPPFRRGEAPAGGRPTRVGQQTRWGTPRCDESLGKPTICVGLNNRRLNRGVAHSMIRQRRTRRPPERRILVRADVRWARLACHRARSADTLGNRASIVCHRATMRMGGARCDAARRVAGCWDNRVKERGAA